MMGRWSNLSKYVIYTNLTHFRTNVIPLNNFKMIESVLLDDQLEIEELEGKEETQKIINSIYFVSQSFTKTFLSKDMILKNELETINKYFLRMVSRSTPFANMVTIRAKGTEKTDIVEMDSSWYFNLLEKYLFTNKMFFLNETFIIKNANAIKISKEYIFILINDYKKNKRKIIKSNGIADSILDLINIRGIETKKLCDILCSKFNIKQDGFFIFIMKLYEMKLITIIIKDTNSNVKMNFQQLKPLLQGDGEEKISSDFDLLNNELAKKEKLELSNLIKKIYNNSKVNYNFSLKSFDTVLDSSISNDTILEFFKKLAKIGSRMPINDQKTRTIDYILEEYGSNVKVPINKILLEKKVISSYSKTNNVQNFVKVIEKESENLFSKMFFENQNDLKEGGFFEALLTSVEGFPEIESICGGDIVFDCLTDIDGKIRSSLFLSEEGLTNHPGKMFGRFASNAGKYAEKNYENFIQSEVDMYRNNGIQLVEIFSDHLDRTVYNVLPQKNYVDNILSFGYPIKAKNYLDINKISIVVNSENKLCLFSKELKSEIKLVNYNMFNPELSNTIYSDLYNLFFDSRHISIFNYIKKVYLSLNEKIDVNYDKLKILNNQYKINCSMIVHFKEKDAFFSYIISQLEKEYIVLSNDKIVFFHTDYNKIIINLDNHIHRDIVYKDIKKNEFISFSKIPDCYSRIINEKDQKFLYKSEVVFSVGNVEIDSSNLLVKEHYSKSDEDVLSITIVQQSYLHNDLLVSLSKELFWLKEHRKISGFFFIRYVEDHRDSIRLRLVFSSGKKESFLPETMDFLKFVSSNKLIDDFKIGKYFPEISRYGGVSNEENIKHIFCEESNLILDKLLENTETIELECFAIYLSIKILSVFDLKSEFKKDVDSYRSKIDIEIRKCYRSNKQLYLSKITDIENVLKENTTFINYGMALNNFKKGIAKGQDNYAIVSSIIHMMCNRVFGVNQNKERKIRIYTNNIILNYKYNR